MANQGPNPGNIPTPPKLEMRGNLSQNWKRWKMMWDSYEVLARIDPEDMRYRMAGFITYIGPEALKVYEGLPFRSNEEKQDISKVLELMGKYCLGETNGIYIFNNRMQQDGETIDAYANELRSLASTCEFGQLQDDLIRDRIVCGLKDNATRRKLLQESKLKLTKCIDICRATESTTAQLKAMSMSGKEELHFVLKQKKQSKEKKKYSTEGQLKYDCKYCGKKHANSRDACPAYGAKCKKCGRMNHYAVCCRDRKFDKKDRVHILDNSEDSDEELSTVEVSTEEKVYSIESQYNSKIFATLLVQKKPVKFQVDCGATCNVISKKYLPPDTRIMESDIKLSMYDSTKMRTLGTTELKLVNPSNAKRYKGKFVVVHEDRTPLIGSRSAQQMKLIKVLYENIYEVEPELESLPVPMTAVFTKEDIIRKNADIFSGDLGRLEGTQKLEIDPSVSPVKQPLRRIPHAQKKDLKRELDRMEEMGVIESVDTPTDWVSSLVIVKKTTGKLRICIDPKPLNLALKRCHYPLPVVEDILPEIAQAKVFTKCDLKNGFWHIVLEEESSYLTTFGTPFGRYRWKRLPFGISPAPEIFQQRLDEALQDLPGTFRVADDILIIGEGSNLEQASINHDDRFTQFLERCGEKGIQLNPDKLDYKQSSVPYIGHLLTSEGLKIDPNKVNAIRSMPKPVDVQGVQRLIGMTNYLSKFLKGLSDRCEPLRQLTKQENEWNWTDEHDAAFESIQKAITEAPVLKYYNSEEPVTLQCDASDTGLGATLLQNQQPVAYGSRALTATERNYAQIEKELLSILFGFTRFHQYLYGRKVTVESDHKPLEIIHKKPLIAAPKRLQRMLLALQKYDYTIVYKKGKEMYLADTLSRAYLNDTGSPQEVDIETQQINMTEYLPVSSERLSAIQQETTTDQTLQAVKEMIQSGWPEQKSEVPNLATPYFNIRDELSMQDGIIFRGSRCVVPQTMRKNILERLHSSHSGIEACKRRARDCVYWPNMNSEVGDYVSKCDICNVFVNKQQKETLIPHETTDRPWAKIGTDILTYNQKDYLVTVDYFSDYFEIDQIAEKTGKQIIQKLKSHMARHGIPDTLVSDNGPPFNSHEFAEFATTYEFQHITSSPGYPQSNGKVESAVKIAKGLVKKTEKAKADPYLALLNLRNTPTEGMTSSPAQRLFSRRTKTLLPTTKRLLEPSITTQVLKEKQLKVQKQAKYYNRHTKDLPPLHEGDKVSIQPIRAHEREWKQATVNKQVNIRSYEVELEDGNTLRRNRRHLQVRKESHNVKEDPVLIVPKESAQMDNMPEQRRIEEPETQLTNKPEAEAVKEASEKVCEPLTTKRGRVIRTPARFMDYVR